MKESETWFTANNNESDKIEAKNRVEISELSMSA